MEKTETPKKVMRTSAGLRDALFDELDSLRDGTSNPTKANAVAKIAGTVVELVQMEMQVQRYLNNTTRKIDAAGDSQLLGVPLELGSAG